MPSMYRQTDSYIYFLLIFVLCLADSSVPWHLINLPDEHVPYYFYSRPKLKQICRESADCPYQVCKMLEMHCKSSSEHKIDFQL